MCRWLAGPSSFSVYFSFKPSPRFLLYIVYLPVPPFISPASLLQDIYWLFRFLLDHQVFKTGKKKSHSFTVINKYNINNTSTHKYILNMCMWVHVCVPHCGLLTLRRQLCEIRFLYLPSPWIVELNSDHMVCVAVTFICWATSPSIASNFIRKKNPDIPFPHCLSSL